MSSETIRDWIAILANVGVLVGIVFLIVEVDQNSTDLRMEARISLSERFSEQDGSIADNPQLAELIVRADRPDADLTDGETRQVQAQYDRWMNILMAAEVMFEAGALTEADWTEYLCEARTKYLQSPHFRSFVETAKARYLRESIYAGVADPVFCGA